MAKTAGKGVLTALFLGSVLVEPRGLALAQTSGPSSSTPASSAASPSLAAPPPTAPGSPPGAGSTPSVMRLEDAVALAVSKNERARLADLNVDVAQAGVEKARAGFLPVLTMTGGDQQRPESTKTSPLNVGTAAVQFNQPVVNVPAWPLYSAAKATLESTKAQTVDDRRLLAFDAAKAYLAVLSAEQVVLSAERRLESAKSALTDTTARADAQLASTNDVTRAQIALGSAAREVETDRGLFSAAIVSLELVVNAQVPGKVAPPDETMAAARNPLPPFQDLMQVAVNRRPDVQAKKHAAQAAHDSASEPLLRIIPTLNLTGQANTSTNTPTGSKVIDESLGLSLTWTIFDAGTRYADKHSRDAQAEIADLTVVALVRSVDAQVKSASVTLLAAQAALKEADKAVIASRKSAEETSILYRQGLAKAIELVDANDQVFLAEVNYTSAEYTMAQAYIALRQAIGLFPVGTELK